MNPYVRTLTLAHGTHIPTVRLWADIQTTPEGLENLFLRSERASSEMAPKKKNTKKGNDDWEAELGESIAPPAVGSPTPDANDDDDAGGAGGLMAVMRKNKEKRKKKGLTEDFVEGENPPAAEPTPEPDLTAKAPEEANLDDEFALPDKKGKGGKGKQQQTQKVAPEPESAPANDHDDEDGESGRVLSKAEKEKLKKEREKQRKKEQVCHYATSFLGPPEESRG